MSSWPLSCLTILIFNVIGSFFAISFHEPYASGIGLWGLGIGDWLTFVRFFNKFPGFVGGLRKRYPKHVTDLLGLHTHYTHTGTTSLPHKPPHHTTACVWEYLWVNFKRSRTIRCGFSVVTSVDILEDALRELRLTAY